MSRTPTIAEVIRRAVEARLVDVHTAIPARVTRYDATTCVVDAAPLVRAPETAEDGTVTYTALPVVTNVPVAFPGAGGFRVTFPVAVGDTVLLVFTEASLDRWMQFGGEVDPEDPRRFALSDAIAIPGVRPAAQAVAAATDAVVVESTADIRLGTKTAAEAVALASKVATELNTLKSAINTAPVTPGDGGATFKAAIMAALTTWPSSTASARVKADS